MRKTIIFTIVAMAFGFVLGRMTAPDLYVEMIDGAVIRNVVLHGTPLRAENGLNGAEITGVTFIER